MPGSRHARHTRNLEATKEIFESPSYNGGNADDYYIGRHHGSRLNANGEHCMIEMLVPWDFDSLVELVIVVIPFATSNNMRLQVGTDYAIPNQFYNHNQSGVALTTINYGAVIINKIYEVPIHDLVSTPPLSPNQYLGITVQDPLGLNGLVLGARMKYNTPVYL